MRHASPFLSVLQSYPEAPLALLYALANLAQAKLGADILGAAERPPIVLTRLVFGLLAPLELVLFLATGAGWLQRPYLALLFLGWLGLTIWSFRDASDLRREEPRPEDAWREEARREGARRARLGLATVMGLWGLGIVVLAHDKW